MGSRCRVSGLIGSPGRDLRALFRVLFGLLLRAPLRLPLSILRSRGQSKGPKTSRLGSSLTSVALPPPCRKLVSAELGSAWGFDP